MDLLTDIIIQNRQIIGTTNSLPQFESEDVEWQFADVEVKVYKQEDCSCTAPVSQLPIKIWSTVGGTGGLNKLEKGFDFQPFEVDFVQGLYVGLIVLNIEDQSIPLFSMKFKVSSI